MNFYEPETYEEKRLRLGLIPKETKSSIWIAVLIFVFLVILLIGSRYTSLEYLLSSNGAGNPYECFECKQLGFACKEHREVTQESLMREKVERYVTAYSGSCTMEESKGYMYSNSQYNESCDFCNAEKSECYSCQYTRETIYNSINTLEQEGSIYSLFCEDCSLAGFPKCYHDKMQTVSLVLDRLK